MKILAWLVVVLICSADVSASDFLKRGYEGWHWYEDKQKQQKEEEGVITYPEGLTPTERKKYVQKLHEEALDLANENPTEQNVLNYIRIQKVVLDRAENFSKTYTRVMQVHPELNGEAQYPTSRTGNELWRQEQKQAMDKTLTEGAKKYGLFYFYRSTCKHCKKFVPTLKHFQKKYGFELLPITLDGIAHPELPDTQTNEDLAQKLQVKGVPALYLVDSTSQKILPMSFGITSMKTLKERAKKVLDSQKPEVQHEN